MTIYCLHCPWQGQESELLMVERDRHCPVCWAISEDNFNKAKPTERDWNDDPHCSS